MCEYTIFVFLSNRWLVGTCGKAQELSSVPYDDLEGWDGRGRGAREAPVGGDVCIHRADSLCCTAETNTLQCDYTPIKKIKEVYDLQSLY